ncbi:uncharacterized protein LOC113277977 [Papaver somniferum]|nr:uncharacterized protein LOC113277977 [Papaver somniferum]
MASKIHIFRKSAMEAGTPEKYYINPSEKLMSMVPDWRVVEHENAIELISNRVVYKGALIFGRIYNNQAIHDSENKYDDYSYIMNTDFLMLRNWSGRLKMALQRLTFLKSKLKTTRRRIRRMLLDRVQPKQY